METITLKAQSRDVAGKSPADLRQEKMIPAVVYGHGFDNHHISVAYVPFEKALAQAGESTLVDLVIDDGTSIKTLIQDVQRHPLTESIIHIDFRQVNMSEVLEADVEFNFVGESLALKAGGILVKSLDKVTVRCLPTDLVSEIEIDLTPLKAIGDRITIGDLTPPKGIEFQAEPETVIVIVNEAMSEDEMKRLEQQGVGDVSQVKTAADEKKAATEEEAK